MVSTTLNAGRPVVSASTGTLFSCLSMAAYIGTHLAIPVQMFLHPGKQNCYVRIVLWLHRNL